MMFALGAAGSLIDALSSLGSSKSSSATKSEGQSQDANPFDLGGGTQTQAFTGSSSTARGPSISPQTMSALIEAQSQSGATSTAPTDSSDALKDLFSQIDADGDGSITKKEFEDALGAGGTNVAAADDVFGKLDSDQNGSVSLDELKSALQGAGHHGHHRHAHAASSSTSADGSTDSTSTDPLAALSTSGLTNLTDKLKLQPIDISKLRITALDPTSLVNTVSFDSRV
jgi:hypothetical protein